LSQRRARELGHNQATDIAFEDNCRRAMLKHFAKEHYVVKELARVLYHDKELGDGKKPHTVKVIEWDGRWKDQNGITHIMECKHFMTLVFSIEFLVLNCFAGGC
jgi:hypothetical protein